MEKMTSVMVVRWRRRVAMAVAIISLLFVVFLILRAHQLFDVCPNSSQLHHAMTSQSSEQFSDVLRLRPADSLSSQNRSQVDDFQRDVVRPTDSLPTVAVTRTRTESGSRRRQFVLHRCPTSYNITDPDNEWFRSVIVQRSPPTSQVTFTEEILIVTPISNSERHLKRYFENLCSLAYPHRLLSVVLGEDSSDDNTVQVN